MICEGYPEGVNQKTSGGILIVNGDHLKRSNENVIVQRSQRNLIDKETINLQSNRSFIIS